MSGHHHLLFQLARSVDYDWGGLARENGCANKSLYFSSWIDSSFRVKEVMYAYIFSLRGLLTSLSYRWRAEMGL
jgi:hypothetical protein